MSSAPPLRLPSTALLALALVGTAALAVEASPAREGEVTRPTLPGPSPRLRPPGHDPEAANRACEGCHTEIAAEWRGSMHQQAWVDPVFQDAYAIEPLAFCRGCHAPEADSAKAPGESARAVGVGCTTCHQQGDDVVGTRDVTARAGAHAVVGDARLATRAACGGCHQFDFPRTPGKPMQSTLEEHRRSKLASMECQSCHMPSVEAQDGSGERHRSHDFSVIRDPVMIRSAANIGASRKGARAVAVTIEATQVGHAFPTGDMFRRLEVRAEAVDDAGRVVARARPVHLGRRFGDRQLEVEHVDFRRVEIADTRVRAPGTGPARVAELAFGVDVDGLTVRWAVAYQRMGDAMAASFGVEQPRDEILVDSGSLGPLPEKRP